MNGKFSGMDRTNIIAFEVSKASLTVHRLPEDQQITILKTVTAIKRLLKPASKDRTTSVICEVSGGYERSVLEPCFDLELPVHCAHGTQTRNFAQYLGLSTNTNAIDARMLALFAANS